MNIELISINPVNTKNEVSNKGKNINNKRDFESNIYEESNKIEKEDDDNQNDTIFCDKENKDLIYEIEDCDYKYYGNIIANQYLNKDEVIEKITAKDIFNINNKLTKEINFNEESSNNGFEVVDSNYLYNDTNNIISSNIENTQSQDLLQSENVYEISYNSSKKEEVNLDIFPESNEVIKSIDELDILGEISMLKSDKFFYKSTNEDIKSLSYSSETNIENRLNNETIKNIKLMKTEDIKELSIKLRPRELGDMHIKLVQENDTLSAVITVSDKDVYNIMNKNLSDLKQHIELFNVKEISIVVDSENKYSSDSFDKSFEDKRRNENYQNKKNKNKNNIQLNTEENSICKQEDGINLLI